MKRSTAIATFVGLAMLGLGGVALAFSRPKTPSPSPSPPSPPPTLPTLNPTQVAARVSDLVMVSRSKMRSPFFVFLDKVGDLVAVRITAADANTFSGDGEDPRVFSEFRLERESRAIIDSIVG